MSFFREVGLKSKVTISPRPSRASQLRVLTRTVGEAFKITTFNALRHPLWLMMLHIALREQEGIETCVTDLLPVIGRSQAAVSRSVSAAVEENLISTYVSPLDGRKTCVKLTKLGQQFIDKVLDAMADAVMKERVRQSVDLS